MYALYRLMDLVSPEDAIKVIDKMDALDALVYDGNIPNCDWSSSRMAYHRARYCMKLNRHREAIEQLSISAEMALAFDNRPDEQKTASFLLGEKTRKKTDFETADSRPLREVLRDSWLAEKEFDAVRNTAEFKAIVETLS